MLGGAVKPSECRKCGAGDIYIWWDRECGVYACRACGERHYVDLDLTKPTRGGWHDHKQKGHADGDSEKLVDEGEDAATSCD